MLSPSASALPPGTRLKGRYEIVRLIKGGGMSWIYQVRELRNGTAQLWALKELRIDEDDNHSVTEALHLFEQEAHILVRLSHPNLPRVAAFFTEGQRSYLVMEFIHGESLQERLNTARAPLLESQVTGWAVQLLGVLSYLHRQDPPVIFRDLKPSNVMVTPDGEIKLIDFGIARTYKAGKQRDTISMGSENYAAPEQWGHGQTDARSDIYATGATLYHLLGNEAPLPAFVPGERTPLSKLNASVSERMETIIERAMARERQDRYQTADEMRQALLRLLPPWDRLRLGGLASSAGQQTPSTSPSPVAPAGLPSRRVQPASPAPLPRPAEASRPAEALFTTEPVPSAVPAPTARPSLAPSPGPVAYCPRCGAGNRDRARYCTRCGQRLESSVTARLELSGRGVSAARFDLPADTMTIGRRTAQQNVDIDLSQYDPKGYISRQHARVTRANQAYWISDLNSSNGTSINGRRIAPGRPVQLRDGDIVRMGKLELRFTSRP